MARAPEGFDRCGDEFAVLAAGGYITTLLVTSWGLGVHSALDLLRCAQEGEAHPSDTSLNEHWRNFLLTGG